MDIGEVEDSHAAASRTETQSACIPIIRKRARRSGRRSLRGE
jgi:hypothetical protein